ncbi:MAG: hypothetical protein QOG60_2171 [Frankiaceae bacterium]|jgi:hypothetical protein|nr:hypothetical protein [Frankiaceae bacterium]
MPASSDSPQGRQVLVAGAAATVLGLVLGLLWHFVVKSGR